VTRALSEATAGDLVEWAAYAELEPFGPLQDSRRAGTQAAASLAPWSEKGKVPKPEDFFPELRPARGAPEPMSAEEIAMRCRGWVVAAGGEVTGG
jgi:hypothetical protein